MEKYSSAEAAPRLAQPERVTHNKTAAARAARRQSLARIQHRILYFPQLRPVQARDIVTVIGD